MKETGERPSDRLSIGVDTTTRDRYSSLLRITPWRKFFPLEIAQKGHWQGL
jgi:hypothetical protein